MARKKSVNPYSVQSVLGIVFTAIGVPFLVIGIILAMNIRSLMEDTSDPEQAWILPFVFVLIGAIFAAIGLGFVIWLIRKNKAIKKVIEGGYTVNAVISDIVINNSIEINGGNPYVISCQYQDPRTGILHIFRSKNIMFFPRGLVGSTVRVFVDPQNFKNYYVDIDSMLPQVQIH